LSKFYTELDEKLQEIRAEKKIFFVGTADTDGRVNLFTKGMGSLKNIKANQLMWLNLTGIVNETAAHLLKQPRMTLMLCSFKGKPLILRVYGKAGVIHSRDEEWMEWITLFMVRRKYSWSISTLHIPSAALRFQALNVRGIGKTWFIGQIKSVMMR
jgi:hypothetical protein